MKRIITIVFIINLGLKVFAQPVLADFSILSLNKLACNSTTIEFYNTSDSSSKYKYVWDFGDNSIKDTTIFKAPNTIKHSYNNDGKFTITLTIVDFKKTDSILAVSKPKRDAIKVYSPKIGEFTLKPDDFETYNLTFTNPTSFKPFNPQAWTYIWDFGDNTPYESTDSNAIFHHFKEENFNPGYKVKLTVQLKDEIKLNDIKPAECFDSVSVVVAVKDGFFKVDSNNKKKPLIPNIFTPNGDGINEEIVLSQTDTSATVLNALKGNDVFIFKANGEQLFSFWVYNRWGQLVYKTENKIITWNGKSSSGDDLNSGVYYYVIQSNASDKRHNTAGVIHLFRE